MAKAEDSRTSVDCFMVFVMVLVTFAVLMIERLAYKILISWHELSGRS